VLCQFISCFLSKKNIKGAIMGNKKVFSTRVDEDRIKELKHLAVDTGKSLGKLLEEAIQELLKKYEKKAKE
jgi:predicted transcriptional regulator